MGLVLVLLFIVLLRVWFPLVDSYNKGVHVVQVEHLPAAVWRKWPGRDWQSKPGATDMLALILSSLANMQLPFLIVNGVAVVADEVTVVAKFVDQSLVCVAEILAKERC